MNRIISILIIVLSLSYWPVSADEACDSALQEGKQEYNKGNYTKAKQLFEFAQKYCGSSYGGASSWIEKCKEALTPKLTVSQSYFYPSHNAQTYSITVTSNREWNVSGTNSNMFSVSRYGNTVYVNVNSNPNTSSRNGYFYIKTTDGQKTQTITISQSGKPATEKSQIITISQNEKPATELLTVSKTEISASAYGTTEYLTVTSDRSWEVQYPNSSVYNVTRNGNFLTVKINENTYDYPLHEFFYVKTSDGSKSIKITISQSAKTLSSSNKTSYGNHTAQIEKIWVDHNQFKDGKKGMKIHVKFSVQNMLSLTGRVVAYFYYDDGSSTPLKDYNNLYKTTDGNVSVGCDFTPGYQNSSYNDFTLFMPYSELHCTGKRTYKLKFIVSILDNNKKEMTQSRWYRFTLSN